MDYWAWEGENGAVAMLEPKQTVESVETPKTAVACTNSHAGKSRVIPIYAQNGTTVIGTFTTGG
jgi:hypothetical protein